VDSNHHAIASASPSSWCVCQFRHDRMEEVWVIIRGLIRKGKTEALSRTGHSAEQNESGRRLCVASGPIRANAASEGVSYAPGMIFPVK
jgi:hypothetical protein